MATGAEQRLDDYFFLRHTYETVRRFLFFMENKINFDLNMNDLDW